MDYTKVLIDLIKDEIDGEDYNYSKQDGLVLRRLLDEINKKNGTRYQYLAEIDEFDISGSGKIMVQYLDEFQSESVRCYLIPQIVSDKVDNCAEIVLKAYLHFKQSEEYISLPGMPAPAHIYVRYDNAFTKMKSRRIKRELLSLAYSPRDAFYLPLTMRMLASWKIPEMKDIMIGYVMGNIITHESVGLPLCSDNYYPSFDFMKRELIFTALTCLKYYPSEATVEIIYNCLNDSDKDIRIAARKSLSYIEKHQVITHPATSPSSGTM